MYRVPLKLHFLAHQRSDAAMEMARSLVTYFQEPPASGGLRIPAFVTPDSKRALDPKDVPDRKYDFPPEWGRRGINLDDAEHSVVVVLSDARMARKVNGGTGPEWKAFLEEGIRKASATGDHRVFGVALDGNGFSLSDKRHMLKVEPAPKKDGAEEDFALKKEQWISGAIEDLALEITVQMIQLLEPKAASEEVVSPATLFLSHAKRDLDPGEKDPVRWVEDDIKELPIGHWIDSAEIPPSKEFAEVIHSGIRDCSIVLAFLTDSYASRSWCIREIFDAKKMGVPILVVDALEDGEPRNFPYLGNLPVIRWSQEEDDAGQKRIARRVVGRAIRECLKYIHNRAVLENVASKEEIVLAAAPEALSLAFKSDESDVDRVFLYPDPPLIREELEVLNKLRPNSSFVTPLTRLARNRLPDSVRSIVVSISESGDLARFGLTSTQEASLCDEIHLYLLLAGLQIAYGGGLSSDTSKAHNFTLRLFELVRSYADLAERVGAKGLHPVLNYAPWPLRLGYGDDEFNLFGEIAEYIECPRPDEEGVPEADDLVFPENVEGWRLLPRNPEQRLAWSLGLTLMRKQSTEETQARVVIGGKMENYFGLFPGVVEEAWHSILAQKPLYLVGVFGGGAQAVIDALDGNSSAILDSCKKVSQLDEIIGLAESRQLEIIDTTKEVRFDQVGSGQNLIVAERLAADLRNAGQKGIDQALNNGLTEEENRELFRSSDPARIAELVLRGLSQLDR